MQATLTGDARPAQLRPGVQRAIGSSANDEALAAELELASILNGPAFQGSARSEAAARLTGVGAHFTAPSLAACGEILEEIERRLAAGEKP